MTSALKEIVGELSGLSAEKQQVAASVIHALWNEEQAEDAIHPIHPTHPEWEAELDRRNAQIESGEVQFVNEPSMDAFGALQDLCSDL